MSAARGCKCRSTSEGFGVPRGPRLREHDVVDGGVAAAEAGGRRMRRTIADLERMVKGRILRDVEGVCDWWKSR